MQYKLPRKLKKKIIGKKMGKSELRRLIESVKITQTKEPNLSSIIEPFEFCPECGCTVGYLVDHHVEYPEVWYQCYCARCDSLTGEADNSVFHHVLEYAE